MNKWSLRARLLAGLIAVTAVFLIVMGTVSTIVLSNLEQDQFSTELALTAKSSPAEIAAKPGDYGAAYVNRATGQVRVLNNPPVSRTATELQRWLTRLAARGQIDATLDASLPPAQFQLTVPGYPMLTAVFRPVSAAVSGHTTLLPDGQNLIVVGRPSSAVGSQVRGLVLTELLTGGILLALLAAGGRRLIVRGLAPLDVMASTADMITSQGDLTARMRNPGDHAEADRLAAAINTMLDRIQQAFTARGRSEQTVRQFAADASHELRTPLTTIRGYAELYRQGALGETELPDAMRRIEQEADRMSSLVAELLELARLDRTSSLDLTETDLSELVRDAVADALAVEPHRPVTAHVLPNFKVVADEPRIRQVLANLLGNVREHTPADTAVTVRLARSSHAALIDVTDTGPGMPDEVAALAFDRFYRGQRGSSPAGSGLGLSIVQAIAAAHGGQATLRSSPEAGTSVQVWIPFKGPAPPQRASSPG